MILQTWSSYTVSLNLYFYEYQVSLRLLTFFFLFSGVLLSCFVTLGRALYGPHTDVVELTGNNFVSMVMDSDSVWLVEFYAPW